MLDLFVAICDKRHMDTLTAHIKAQPEKPMQAWADDFGISRPYLYALLDGSRQPSIDVAVRIAAATKGAVPVSAWPNVAAVLRAAAPVQGGAE